MRPRTGLNSLSRAGLGRFHQVCPTDGGVTRRQNAVAVAAASGPSVKLSGDPCLAYWPLCVRMDMAVVW